MIGAGPAGLMAAEELSRAGLSVLLAEARPSVGRKFLMAGKSGLNLTHAGPFPKFLPFYQEAAEPLRPMLEAFDNAAVQDWARGLGQEVFTGSSGRVFPVVMKASPLLRAWIERLAGLKVDVRTRWRWNGWDGAAFKFDTPAGIQTVAPKVTVLALGGASWARLGSDGAWAELLKARGVALAPFAAANAGLSVDWSPHMARWYGAPIKSAVLKAGSHFSRGEFVISARGLEGGGIYAVSRGVREGGDLRLDLLPDLTLDEIAARLGRPYGKLSTVNVLRKAVRLGGARLALLMEFARPLPAGAALAAVLKDVPVRHSGLRPMDEAISTAGGVTWGAVDKGLMLRNLPGVFVSGEMLDWEAPTGGYLLNACLATGRWAGRAAADFSRKI